MSPAEQIGPDETGGAGARRLRVVLADDHPIWREAVEREGVITSFFQAGPNKIELLESTTPDGPIAKAIAKRGEGIHHVAFEVEDIRAEMARLKAEGFQLLSDEPKPGADNKLVCFVHPKSANGVLVELTQEMR